MIRSFKKTIRNLACLMLIIGMAGFSFGCGKNQTSNADLGNYHDYLGDYYYDCSISAMVYEIPDGETEPGILYRQVLNLDELTKTCPLTVVFFFYSGMQADTYGIFACMEEVAEKYHDKVLIVAIDGIAEKDISAAYNVEAMPEAIVIRNNMQIARFDGTKREEWSAIDFANWIIEEAVNK